MASSSRNSGAARLPLAGNHNFPPQQLSQVDQIDNELKKVMGGIAALRDGAPPGKDVATVAGYDAQNVHKTAAILKEISVAEDELNAIEGDIGLTKKVIIAGQSTTLTGVDLQDKEARKRASSRVVDFVAGSAENTRRFYRGLNISVTPETNAAARTALRELAVSNTNPSRRGPDPAKDLASLQKALKTNHTLSSRYKKERDEFKDAWERSQKENKKLTQTSEQQSRDLYQANKDLEKARREFPQLERDKANRNESYLKTQAIKAKLQADDAEKRAQTTQEKNLDVEKRLYEVNDSLKKLRGSHTRQADQIALLKKQSEGLKEDLKDYKESTKAAQDEVVRLQLDSKSSRIYHVDQMRRLQTAKDGADKRVQEVSDELRQTQIDRSADSASLNSANEELSKVRGELEALQLTVEGHVRDLERKNQRISELEKASDEKDASIKVRDETIDAQIQGASTFLRHLSLDVESDAWKCIAERVLVDSTSTSLTSAEWVPWAIFPSWSEDASLATWEDTRGPEVVALNLLAILRDRSADAKLVLALLHHLQKAIKEVKSMVSGIVQLLIEAFDRAVGDPRLHLMHRFSMCQIATLLGSTGEVERFMQAMDAADPRIRRLVNALGAYRLENSVFPMEEAISYPGVALVGFNRDPQGVIAVSLSDNGICWVDITNIRTEFTLLSLVSGKGDSFKFPLDTAERVEWAMTHA
ncbi:uncharacterized protein FTJAE_13970 [Fusarium tjaetaba]|uniref:Uncharacterized protein n=1 Tax=Fusarium tjaetaba TaxID=1567544 RepID=A0A8H5V6N6_9HYPO|nr:uncharacterized protein FTJAE_13970 [Fusarium tjaetaba]KAF5613067.1 hypothetical protein FTJAE_13970 [Fusarium tjaetaba]